MNRDEQLSRIAGVPPVSRFLGGRRALCPSEPGGGTWVSVNDNGVSFALINWYEVKRGVRGKAMSRGGVVNAVQMAVTVARTMEALKTLPLSRLKPFRLMGFFPGAHGIVEWRWDLRQLVQKRAVWLPNLWASSGYDEPTARKTRVKVFEEAVNSSKSRGRVWLRRLHASHQPECGPFSICMHRRDAATVSFTLISVSGSTVSTTYQDGPPCHHGRAWTRRLKLLSTP